MGGRKSQDFGVTAGDADSKRNGNGDDTSQGDLA
jgi:hypothetical protein